ncbi:MAG: hypothetical protein K0S60_49 [Evtepia sp.]|jgi:hypothetical protein|nr:hypothetical protein [Evtepia sp.]
MSDSVTKIIPYEPSEIDLLENWLNELAAKGLILKDITYIFAVFEKTAPCRTRFRIDFSPKKNRKKDSTRRSSFKELGWQYVTIFSDRYTIYRTDDPFLTDFPTEHAVLRSPSNWIKVAGIIALVPALQSAIFFLEYTDRRIGVLDTLVHDTSLGVYLFLTMIVLFEVILFKRCKAREKRDPQLSRNLPTSGRAIHQVIKKMILPLLIFFLGFGIQHGFQMQKSGPLQNASDHIPFPLLEEINPEEGKRLSEGLKSDEFYGLDSYITRERRLLAPLLIQTIQAGPYLQTDEKTRYYYRVNYYRVLNGQLAKWYAAELSQNLKLNQTIDASAGVTAWYMKAEDGQSLILQYQNIVIEVRYHGATDLRDCIPLYEAYLGFAPES